jgi:hypothetical protein
MEYNRPEMRILFTTPNSLQFLDFKTGQRETLSEGDPEYYGITGCDDQLVLSHSCIDCEQLKSHDDLLSSQLGRLSLIDSAGTTRTERVLLQPHQIEWCDGLIVCANSGKNCLTVFEGGRWSRDVYPTLEKWDVGPSGDKHNHFNSIHIQNGRAYVVAHNYERDSAVWIFQPPSFSLMDVVPTRAEWAHNVWVQESDLIVCNSKAGALYSVALKSNIWVHEGGGYITRGLAANEEHIIVGISALASRGDRKDSDSGFCIIDRKSMRTLDTIIFPGCGAIHDVRLLDEVDLCHGAGILRLPPALSRVIAGIPMESHKHAIT